MVRLNLSTCPCDVGVYGDPFINFIPSFGIRFLIIVETNYPPLSLCKITGTPSFKNNSQSRIQTLSDSLVLRGKAQAYLLKQSMTVNIQRYPLFDKLSP